MPLAGRRQPTRQAWYSPSRRTPPSRTRSRRGKAAPRVPWTQWGGDGRERSPGSRKFESVRLRRRSDGRRQGDRLAERTRQVRRSQEKIVRGACLGTLGRQQRELRVGHLELRGQAAGEAQRREPERLGRLGGILLPGGEDRLCAAQLGACPCGFHGHRLTLLAQLELGEPLLGLREIHVGLHAEAVEEREGDVDAGLPVGEEATVLAEAAWRGAGGAEALVERAARSGEALTHEGKGGVPRLDEGADGGEVVGAGDGD